MEPKLAENADNADKMSKKQREETSKLAAENCCLIESIAFIMLPDR
jgi:hypothetical protein